MTNGVAVFQHNINNIVEENLDTTFPFLDNVTVCGHSKEELVANENKFRETEKYRLTLNESKTVSAVQTLPILGYLVSKGEIKPDPEWLRPLRNLGAPFNLETDASDYTIAATLNLGGRPVTFFSRTLTKTEQHHSPVEKEACAIVESITKWCHYLQGRQFKLVTDQRSVAFMYDRKQVGKVKNDKIMRWRTDLSSPAQL